VDDVRQVLRKLEKMDRLSPKEYEALLTYAAELRSRSPESYRLFYERFAGILKQEYATYLPRSERDQDDLINYLLENPELPGLAVDGGLPPQSAFPREYHPVLVDIYNNPREARLFQSVIALLTNLASREAKNSLPRPRSGEAILKYEDDNPYKEPGLKTHFERLARYTFITRLQSYRYLSRNKAAFERIEVIGPDCLGGIFTNKEKSIYYYIFLSESDPEKAAEACRVLNAIFYPR
jgi:hypothetical protein